MKQNIKFFSIVILLILVSSIALTGAMHAVGDYDEGIKPYEKSPKPTSNILQDSEGDINYKADVPNANSPIEDDPISDTPIGGDAPNSQQSMKAKFEAMYDIDDAENTITVISADTLERIWQSNYEKEVVRSLAVEEVYYIIQDSVRIYNEYDRVILSEFAPSSSDEAIVARIPSVEGKVIDTTKSDCFEHYYEYTVRDLEAIVRIVIYRLRALSSPGALFTGEEVIRAVGADPGVYSTMLPKTLFYIPDYSKDNDRIEYIAAASLTILSNTVPSETLSDIFALCEVGGYIDLLQFETGYNGRESAKIFPTVEMKDRICPYFSSLDRDYKKIRFFPEPALEFCEGNGDFEEVTLTDVDMLTLRRYYNDGQGWTLDAVVDREAFHFDGRIRFGTADGTGWMYFGIENDVLYYNEMFTSLSDEVAEIINKCRPNN